MTKSDINVSLRDTDPLAIGYLLIPQFSLLAYATAVEPLRAANTLSGRILYRWHHLSPDGRAAAASNGVTIMPDRSLEEATGLDVLFVVAGGNPAAYRDRVTLSRLRRLGQSKLTIGGISGGTYILARAGLLRGYRCTLHWEHAESFREDFPDIDLRRSLYEIDRDRLTCSGGTAPLDLLHELIARHHGAALARRVSDWFLQTEIRAGPGPDRMAAGQRFGVRHATLQKVLTAIEAETDTPLSPRQLAAMAGMSLRQLERLFRSHLGITPRTHDRRVRLDRARLLLRQTNLSVLEVAVACGFASASHFSRAYHAMFGHPPVKERTAVPRDITEQIEFEGS
jgi:transcriptional regulator GlxA family with amidase domain